MVDAEANAYCGTNLAPSIIALTSSGGVRGVPPAGCSHPTLVGLTAPHSFPSTPQLRTGRHTPQRDELHHRRARCHRMPHGGRHCAGLRQLSVAGESPLGPACAYGAPMCTRQVLGCFNCRRWRESRCWGSSARAEQIVHFGGELCALEPSRPRRAHGSSAHATQPLARLSRSRSMGSRRAAPSSSDTRRRPDRAPVYSPGESDDDDVVLAVVGRSPVSRSGRWPMAHRSRAS